jgi:hypothetical protein
MSLFNIIKSYISPSISPKIQEIATYLTKTVFSPEKNPTMKLPIQEPTPIIKPTIITNTWPTGLVPDGYKPGDRQIQLLKGIVDLKNEIETLLGLKITIGCGIRTDVDVERLIRQGYHPAKKSDHFYGIPMKQDDESIYVDSAGAADLYIKDLSKHFKTLVNHFLNEPDPTKRPRQMIYETGKVSDWLHIANKPATAWPEAPAKHLHAKPLLYSFDCGKTYQIFDPSNPPERLRS